jgi:VWFA-related protein
MWKKTHWMILIALVAALFAGPTVGYAQSGAPQVRVTQVDNSKFPQVTVYVSVTNAAGEPVAVDPATIQLEENGKVMHPTHVGAGSEGGIGPLNTMLVMDVSGSMDKNGKIDGAKDAAKAYVEQMRPGDRTGLMVYNTKTKYIQPLTSDTTVLLSAIDSIQTGGDTSMYDALVVAEQDLEGVSGRKAIITLTDGLDNHSSHTADDVINGIGAGGLSISTIGLGDSTTKAQSGLDVPALTSLAQRAGGVYSFAGDPQSLSALFQQYGRALQNEYAITYISPETLRDGVNRSLSVSLVGTAASTTSIYNPGGVLPEVASQSWILFVAILLGLVALLLAPAVISWAARGAGGKHRKGRIRLVGPEASRTSASSMAHGRIKLK